MERVTYKEAEVIRLEDFNLQIYEGEIMGMVPFNGYGMTEFLELLQTNIPIYDGYIYYNGELVNSWKESSGTHNRISIIQAKSSLVESMTVADNVCHAVRIPAGSDPDKAAEQAASAVFKRNQD